MIEYKTGDILNEDTEAIINTVNCVGVMGRGIALQFKNIYPENFKAYAAACKQGEIQPGKMFVFPTGKMTTPRLIINFPTKRHWRGQSRLEDVELGLRDLVKIITQYKIRSVAVPPLGCGLGGLDWNIVRDKIIESLGTLSDTRVVVFEPQGAPSPKTMKHIREVPDMTAGRAALILLIDRYLQGLLDPSISLLEVHKLMYFMQEAGENLRLNFVKAHYGPYAENLRQVLNRIEGCFISGYADGDDDPEKELELVPAAVEDAWTFLLNHADTQQRFDAVSKLVDGFEHAFGMELIATVHWIVKNEKARTLDEVVQRVHGWNERKRLTFSARHIGIAVEKLVERGWITPLHS